MEERFLKEGLYSKNKIVFDFIFQYYYSGLCVYAESLIKDEEFVEDIVQDFFVTLWINGPLLEIKGSLKNYLFTSVKNRCYDYLKHQKVKSKSRNLLKALQNSSQETPENWLVESELREKIESSLQSMPPRCQEIFRLSRYSGLKNKEIADKLGLSKRTVELQISNALKILRRDLKPLLPVFLLSFL